MRVLTTIFLLVALASSNQSCEGQVKPRPNTSRQDSVFSIDAKQKQQRSDVEALLRPEKRNVPGADFRYAARKVTPAVVHVNSIWKPVKAPENLKENPLRDFFGEEFWRHFFEPYQQRGPSRASASGVIITSDGYIITNNHVIDGANEVEVVLHDQRSYSALVIGTDPSTDIALIKIEEKGLHFISFGNSDEVEVGEWVLAVGNPFNLASTVTAGIVSAKARNINILSDREAVESFIQTDAAVNPGNSGGALVDLNGELIGINTAIATPTGTYAGYSFAIPINIVKKVADDLLNYGMVKRGYLGVFIRSLTGPLAKELGVKFTRGVYVDSLVQNGAAFEAGIKKGDIITRINGIRVETTPQLQGIIAGYRPGENLIITVVRKDAEKQIPVTLHGTSEVVPAFNEETSIFEMLGIDVREISEQEKSTFNVQYGLQVTKIYQGKISEFTNMREGFIITKVNGKAVGSKNDLISSLKNKGGILVEGIYPGSSDVVYYGFGV